MQLNNVIILTHHIVYYANDIAKIIHSIFDCLVPIKWRLTTWLVNEKVFILYSCAYWFKSFTRINSIQGISIYVKQNMTEFPTLLYKEHNILWQGAKPGFPGNYYWSPTLVNSTVETHEALPLHASGDQTECRAVSIAIYTPWSERWPTLTH